MILAAVVGALPPYIGGIIRGSNPGAYYTSQIAHAVLFVLIIAINGPLGRLRPSWLFNRGELVVLFIMMSLANAAGSVLGPWRPLVASPLYQATAENNWHQTVIPFIPDWLIPQDVEAMRAFYEGSTSAAPGIPWAVWAGPLLNWLPLVLALQGAMLCLMVLLRRAWAEQERLIYPIMQLNLSMVQPAERGSMIAPFFRNPVMWMGLSVPVIVGTVIGLHAYFQYMPTIDVAIPFPVFKGPRISFATLGFFFLIQREVALALWVFTLLNDLQEFIYGAIGWGVEKQAVVSVWSYGNHSLVHQGMGAMIVLVLGGLWVAREHLGHAFRKAFVGADEVKDDDEILSYRGAVFGLIICLGTMLFCVMRMNIPLVGALVFLFFAFVVFVGLTRAVAEGGVAVIYAPMVAPDATLSALGSAPFGARGLISMGYMRGIANDLLNFTMPHMANGLKLTGQIAGSRRWLFWGMLLGVICGVAGSFWMAMHLAHSYGVINMGGRGWVWYPDYVFSYSTALITTPTGPNWFGWLHTAIGSMVMILLLLARRLWTWWPLHPIGFPISSTLNWIAFNAFLAWAIKGPVMRYGGVRLYRKVRPFFLGMILGHFVIFAVFWVIDATTGMVGNSLFY